MALTQKVMTVGGIDRGGVEALMSSLSDIDREQEIPERLPTHFVFEFITTQR